MRFWRSSAVMAAIVCAISIGCSPPPDMVQSGSPEDVARSRALEMYAELSSGKLDRGGLTKEMDAAYTPALIKTLQPQLATLGPPATPRLLSKQDVNGATDWLFNVTFSGGDHRLEIILQPDSKIAGFHVLP